MSPDPAFRSNRILAALPRREAARLSERCDVFDLRYGAILFEPGERMRHVYFPTSGLVSLLTPIADRITVEVGLVGDDGMAGVSMLLGVPISPVRGLVQGSGSALRMPAVVFHRAIADSAALQRGLNRYLYCFMAQVAQTAACNRYHAVAQRLARWMLMTQDRMHADTFQLTQEFLAHMLGVRRVAVTAAAGILRNQDLIAFSRGNFAILDRRGLEHAACRCYAAVGAICAHTT